MHLAAEFGHASVVAALLATGVVDPNARNSVRRLQGEDVMFVVRWCACDRENGHCAPVNDTQLGQR